MGTAGRHIKGVVSVTAAQRQIVLHSDVITQQQPICQETWDWEEAPPYNPPSTAPLGAAHAATIENSPVLLKKPSPIRIC